MLFIPDYDIILRTKKSRTSINKLLYSDIYTALKNQ